MTQDEIIEMARQAGFSLTHSGLVKLWLANSKDIEVFAKLVAAKATDEANAKSNASWALMCKKMVEQEREACAKVCESLPTVGELRQLERATMKDCAHAIRARGEA